MQHSKFYRLGTLIYSFRWLIIALWVLIVLSCTPFLPAIISPFKTTGFVDEHSESAKTDQLLSQKMGFSNKNRFIIIYTSDKLLATSATFKNKVKKSLSKLKNFPIEQYIIYPDNNKKLMSKDKHSSYVVVIIKSKEPISNSLLTQFQSLIKTPTEMTMLLGGEPLFIEKVNQQTQIDLYKADLIAAPVSIIVLLLVFGSLFAALLPIILGGGCALITLTSLYFIGHAISLSIFTLNIALLLGLCLSLDYSLFIIYRFRDELENNLDIVKAIAVTQATAGKAIFFSGLAVFTSLGALLIFPVNILFSVAIGGLTAVFVAVVTAIVILPALLSVLNTKINLFPVRLLKQSTEGSFNFWRSLAEHIVKRPRLVFFCTLTFLLALGYPFLSAKFGVSDFHILPEASEQRHFYNTYSKEYNEKELNPILLVLQSKDSPILSRTNLTKLMNLARTIKDHPLVLSVDSIVTTKSKLTKEQYYKLYHLNKKLMSPDIKKLLATTTRDYLTVMTVTSKYPINSEQTRTLITDLRHIDPGKGMSMQLTGIPVNNIEVLDTISHLLPYAILWIMLSTYLILLILLRSLFLPLKAILMNIISLSACYGALVLVFQDGYLHHLLNFDLQGMLDISLLVIIFCALFGFSVDYEVFLLSRIKEFYELGHDNKESIVFGIVKSSRIITSAAVIVICLCFSFLVAEVLMVKAFGLGIAVAIFVDAFIIRTALVPATMMLFKKWNWYIPKCLDKILPKL